MEDNDMERTCTTPNGLHIAHAESTVLYDFCCWECDHYFETIEELETI